MRRLNIFIVAAIFISFAAHAVMGALRLYGSDANALPVMAFVCAGLIGVHVVVTTILTCQTLKARRLSGAGYFRHNLLFWARRISGFTILIPLVMHIIIMSGSHDGAFRLLEFNGGRLASQIIFIVTLGFHILTNIQPALISLGIRSVKAFSADILFLISVILLFAAGAFCVYYFRWMAY